MFLRAHLTFALLFLWKSKIRIKNSKEKSKSKKTNSESGGLTPNHCSLPPPKIIPD